MDAKKTLDFISHEWDSSIIPALQEYIRIPNQSPSFDPNWATNGLLDKAAELEKDWVLKQGIEGLKLEIVRLPNRTPLIFIEVPAFGNANANDVILMYGHLDKQPPLLPWAEGLHPYEPVIKVRVRLNFSSPPLSAMWFVLSYSMLLVDTKRSPSRNLLRSAVFCQ